MRTRRTASLSTERQVRAYLQERLAADPASWRRSIVSTPEEVRRYEQFCASLVYDGLDDLLLQHGRAFTPQPLPKGYRRMKERACFDNAWQFALRHADLCYAEGLAFGEIAFPIHHAWCVDRDGRVVDPTWPTPGLVYFGVLIGTARVTASMTEQQAKRGEHGSVLDDCSHNWPFFREPFTESQDWQAQNTKGQL